MTLAEISTSSDFTSDTARWAAVQARDPGAEGAFVYGVRTTGVYCRPTCRGRLPRRENVSFHGTPAAAEMTGLRPCKRCRPHLAVVGGAEQPAEPDWSRVGEALDQDGYAVVPRMLTGADCTRLAALYDEADRFRSKVVMRRHGFGEGEYQYFAYPLPDMVARLRAALYPPLADIANRWSAAMGLDARFPDTHEAYLRRCHDAGQTRPTPLLLKYGAGDHNRLHQDLYGDHVFPLQAACLLSQPGRDFTGGEFVLSEQRPHQQSRVEVVPLERGDMVIFPVRWRPIEGARGVYRGTVRHGVSRVRSGERFTLGTILHDAA